MENKCFACGKSFDTTQRGILARYKASHQRTGKVYWFYKVGQGELMITNSNGIKEVRKKHANIEFAHISEFITD